VKSALGTIQALTWWWSDQFGVLGVMLRYGSALRLSLSALTVTTLVVFWSKVLEWFCWLGGILFGWWTFFWEHQTQPETFEGWSQWAMQAIYDSLSRFQRFTRVGCPCITASVIPCDQIVVGKTGLDLTKSWRAFWQIEPTSQPTTVQSS
jgi:hypothetical protein